jgi:hypothetical protein
MRELVPPFAVRLAGTRVLIASWLRAVQRLAPVVLEGSLPDQVLGAVVSAVAVQVRGLTSCRPGPQEGLKYYRVSHYTPPAQVHLQVAVPHAVWPQDATRAGVSDSAQ